MDATAPSLRLRVVGLATLAGAADLVLDLLASRLEATTPPYLLLRYAAEVFQELLSPVGVAIAAAAVNGLIAALLALALERTPRRVLVLGASLSGLWVLSGGLMILLYFSPPAPVALGSLAAGIPRGFILAWLLDRVLPRPGARDATA